MNEKADEDDAVGRVRPVDRALSILLAFQPEDEDLTVIDLLRRVDLAKPTLYRLLNSLESNGFLSSTGDPQRFRLGSSVAQLAYVWNASSRVERIAQPVMKKLWDITQETVALFVPEGIFRRCVAEMPSPQALCFKRGVGYKERLVLGASGRSILAHLGLSEAELKIYADGTGLDVESYPAELGRIRARGFAIAKDELIKGAVAASAPFFDGSNRVAGSICIFGPSARVSQEQADLFGRLLVEASSDLSQLLGRQKA